MHYRIFRFLGCCLLLLSGSLLWAQSVQPDSRELASGLAMGLYSSTQGLGVHLWWMQGGPELQRLLGLNLHVLHDPHETFVDSYFGEQGSRYILGKTHHMVAVQPSFGWQKRLVPRASLNTLGIWGSIQAGPSLGVLTPYYLEIFQPNSSGTESNRQVMAYDPLAHSYSRIVGRANPLSTPFSPTVVLGGSLHGQLMIDLAKKEQSFSGMILGIGVEGYAKEISLMGRPEEIQPQRWFLTASMGLLMGRRW